MKQNIFKYKAIGNFSINEMLFTSGDILFIESNNLRGGRQIKQVFNSEKSFVGTVIKEKYEKILPLMEMINE